MKQESDRKDEAIKHYKAKRDKKEKDKRQKEKEKRIKDSGNEDHKTCRNDTGHHSTSSTSGQESNNTPVISEHGQPSLSSRRGVATKTISTSTATAALCVPQ